MKRLIVILFLSGFLIPFAYGEVIYWDDAVYIGDVKKAEAQRLAAEKKQQEAEKQQQQLADAEAKSIGMRKPDSCRSRNHTEQYRQYAYP